MALQINCLTSNNNSCTKRRVHWCFCVEEKDISLVEETSKQGKPVKIKEKMYTLYIGPIKEPDDLIHNCHRLGMIYSKQHAITRGQAKAVLNALEINIQNVMSLLKTCKPSTYLDYAWNSLDLKKSEAEQLIKQCINALTDEGIITTSEKLRAKIKEAYGANFVVHNKSLIDLMMRSPEYFPNVIIVNEKVNQEENFINILKVTNTFSEIVSRAVSKNGYITSHKKFQNLSNFDINLTITMLAILPMIAKRTEYPDDLPGLYFYGEPSSGKSFFFNKSPAYHKVATDAPGVSRYRLQVYERAFLLDDINSKILNDKTNSSTIRNLTLGGVTTVKISGEIQNVQGFVVCTSNDTPDFIEDTSEGIFNVTEANFLAWRRRFITIKFTDFVDEDPKKVDFGYISATEALKYVFDLCYGLLESVPVKEMFNKYHEAINSKLSPEYLEKFSSHQKHLTLKEAFEKVKSLLHKN
jgi:hypothetical protein